VTWNAHLTRHLVSEQPPSTSGTHCPSLDILGVTPDKIAERAFVWNLLSPRYNANLVECPDLGAEASVHAEHLAVYYGGKRKEVEYLAAGFPDRSVAIFLLALFVESVYLCDLAGLVVAADECDLVWVSGGTLASSYKEN